MTTPKPVKCRCGWQPPRNPDSSPEDQLAAHKMNNGCK